MLRDKISRFAVGEIPAAYIGAIPPDAFELHGKHTRFRSTYFDGFGRPKSTVSTSAAATGNFSTYSGSRIQDRTLSFDVYIKDDVARGIDLLYQHLPFDTLLRFYVEDSGGKTVYIDGVVEELPCEFDATKGHTVSVSIVCPFPWFASVRRHEDTLTTTAQLFETAGDIDAGFSLYLTGTAVEALKLTSDAGTFAISGTTTYAKQITETNPAVCTVDGNLTTYNSEKQLMYASILSGSTWFQINHRTGTAISISGESGDPEAHNKIIWHDYYSGVTM